jgi:predicted dehydrogenase
MTALMSRADDPIGWGLVGPGRIAAVFADCIHRTGVGRVVSVTGRSLDRSRAFCEGHGGRAAENIDAVLASGVEAVYVATPHPMHAKSVEAALRAGKAVLCEKPMTTTSAETARLVELSRETKVPLVEAWMYRCHPQITRARDLIEQGIIGELQHIDSAFGYVGDPKTDVRQFEPELGGGAILDIGGYPLSLAMFLAGESGRFAEARLLGVSGELTESGVDAIAEAKLGLGNVTARARAAIIQDLGMTATVRGSEGRIAFDNPFMPESRRDGLVGVLRIEREGEPAREERAAAPHDCFSLEAAQVARLVREGGIEAPAPMVGHDESIAIARVLDAWLTEVHDLAG